MLWNKPQHQRTDRILNRGLVLYYNQDDEHLNKNGYRSQAPQKGEGIKMEFTLESLGFTKKALQEKIIERAVEQLLHGVTYDEDGEEERVESKLWNELNVLIKQHIEETVRALAEKSILPKISEHIENITIQETNSYGEKKGKKLTLIEFLVEKAEVYMLEPVDSDGRSEGECRRKGNSWYTSRQSRISFLVDKNLHDSIETAMKQSLSIANSALATGISGAVKSELENIVRSIQLSVKVK
jgi:hypothetical protein